MARKIAINGFGRIGRLTFRNLVKDSSVEVVAINDLTDNATLAHLLKYDTAHGPFDGTVEATDTHLIVNGKKIVASDERNPENLPWKELDVDIVLECTGIFVTKEKASMHLSAGAKKVILSAPGKSDGITTVVMGVNDDVMNDGNDVFSNASCTTNCLAPLVEIVMRHWGIEQGSVTTTHAYTGDQNLQDGPHRDLRRARAAAQNIVPTTTGAASAVGKVLPDVKGKLNAMALRVPVITGSITEMNVLVSKDVSREEVLKTFEAEANGRYKNILEFCTDPIVSSDIIGNQHSSIFDSLLTEVSGRWVRVVSWYDNESGYSKRLAEVTATIPA